MNSSEIFGTIFGFYHIKLTAMKKLILITIIIPFLISSCVRYPYSDFYTSKVNVKTFEIIEFYNTSTNYDYVEWDFGDGDFSTNPNPTHHYSNPGIYTVTLTVYGNQGHEDWSSLTIEVFNPTILEVTVLEYWNEYPVQDASIILYTSMHDWVNMNNPVLDNYNQVLEGITNSNGIVRFEGLSPVSYWLDVWHEYYNNYALADEDEDFIKTLPLQRNMVNTFIAYVDYVESKSKTEGREISQLKIVKIERTHKDKVENK